MISPVKLIKMARKRQRLDALKRKRISLQRNNSNASTSSSNIRFMFSIPYLDNTIAGELLVMSEEESGLPSGGPITLPLTQSPWNISRSCSSSSCPGQGLTSQQSLTYSFRETNLIL
ncbi:auxin-responsive family protein [Salix suchowensis]|nr:auxin-responsive family protein [Salix suchowensis]